MIKLISTRNSGINIVGFDNPDRKIVPIVQIIGTILKTSRVQYIRIKPFKDQDCYGDTTLHNRLMNSIRLFEI